MVDLVPYDASWPTRFEEIARELRECGSPTWRVEHIGSTAIPGMSAKPSIDVAIRLCDERDFDHHRPGLERAGWHLGSGVRSHRVMTFEAGGERTRITHFFEAREWATANQRLFRDWLIAHPADAALYEQAKRSAVEAERAGIASYNAAKTPVVQEIVDRARASIGLPKATAYDKG